MFHVFFKSLSLFKNSTHFSKQQGVCNNSSHQLHRRQEIPDLKRFVSIFMSVWRLLIPSRVRNLRWNKVIFSSVFLCFALCVCVFLCVVCVIHVGYCSFWSGFISYFELGYGMELCTGRKVVKQGWTMRTGISYGRQSSERLDFKRIRSIALATNTISIKHQVETGRITLDVQRELHPKWVCSPFKKNMKS